MRRKIVWIFCLSCDQAGLLEDTIWNIDEGMKYLGGCLIGSDREQIVAVLIVGDIHLMGKSWKVPERMLEYISKNYPFAHRIIVSDKVILETESLTSRENIPFSLKSLQKQGLYAIDFDHVLCSERKHTWLLRFLLKYHLRKDVGLKRWQFWKWLTHPLPQIELRYSAQKVLGWRGQITRWLQQIDMRLDPNGKSAWYRRKRAQRAQYRIKQT